MKRKITTALITVTLLSLPAVWFTKYEAIAVLIGSVCGIAANIIEGTPGFRIGRKQKGDRHG